LKKKKTIETIAKTSIDVGKLALASFVIGGLLVEEKSIIRILLGLLISSIFIGFGIVLIALNEKEENL